MMARLPVHMVVGEDDVDNVMTKAIKDPNVTGKWATGVAHVDILLLV